MNHMQELAELYPMLSPEELVQAKENLERYLLLSWEIWDAALDARKPTLTAVEASSTIKAKVDSSRN